MTNYAELFQQISGTWLSFDIEQARLNINSILTQAGLEVQAEFRRNGNSIILKLDGNPEQVELLMEQSRLVQARRHLTA